jgi:hypothetical protein
MVASTEKEKKQAQAPKGGLGGSSYPQNVGSTVNHVLPLPTYRQKKFEPIDLVRPRRSGLAHDNLLVFCAGRHPSNHTPLAAETARPRGGGTSHVPGASQEMEGVWMSTLFASKDMCGITRASIPQLQREEVLRPAW